MAGLGLRHSKPRCDGWARWKYEYVTRAKDQRALLILLLVIDGTLILVHVWSARLGASPLDPTWLVMHPWRIDTDRGFAEAFQYLKYAALVGLSLWLYKFRGLRSALPLAVLAVLLFVDDAFQLHETIGAALTARLTLVGPEAILVGSLGELIGFVGLGSAFVWFVVVGLTAGGRERRFVITVTWLIALLAFFGAVVDQAANLYILSSVLDIVRVSGQTGIEVLTSLGLLVTDSVAGAGISPRSVDLTSSLLGLAAEPGLQGALADLRVTKVVLVVIEEGGELISISLLCAFLVAAAMRGSEVDLQHVHESAFGGPRSRRAGPSATIDHPPERQP